MRDSVSGKAQLLETLRFTLWRGRHCPKSLSKDILFTCVRWLQIPTERVNDIFSQQALKTSLKKKKNNKRGYLNTSFLQAWVRWLWNMPELLLTTGTVSREIWSLAQRHYVFSFVWVDHLFFLCESPSLLHLCVTIKGPVVALPGWVRNSISPHWPVGPTQQDGEYLLQFKDPARNVDDMLSVYLFL